MNIKKTVAGYVVTEHADNRMCGRRIGADKVDKVLAYGRVAHVRKAEVYAVGRKEVVQYKRHGIDLRDVEGIQVVVAISDENNIVITAYRNNDFSRLKH